MRFTVGREALGEAVAFVSRALPSRPVVPLLSCILIEVGDSGLTMSCFDYEVSARCTVEAEISEPGTALVPGRLLAEITRSLPARPVHFSDEADVLTMVCGSAEFGLVCLPVEEYPALPGSPPTVGEVDGGLLAAAVTQVASSASRDDTLPMLTAVCLDFDGDSVVLAATDRYRLAARQVPFEPADPGIRALVLVPARIMVEAARTLTAGVPVAVAFSVDDEADATRRGPTLAADAADGYQPRPAEGLISFEAGQRRLTARLIGGEFIRYRSRFAGEFSCHADLAPGPVIEAVRRAALVADRAGPVRLTFSDGKVLIEAHAEGRARAAETVAADFTGDEPVISFNPSYLLDGLVAAASVGAGKEQAQSADAAGEPGEPGRIRLDFNSPAKPALITWVAEERHNGASASADSTQFRYLLVPQRVPDRA
jgi:DNA polymerase III subunit beta